MKNNSKKMSRISDEVEDYIYRRALHFKLQSEQDPNWVSPSLASISSDCKNVTGKYVSPSTVSKRLQNYLGPNLYQEKFGLNCTVKFRNHPFTSKDRIKINPANGENDKNVSRKVNSEIEHFLSTNAKRIERCHKRDSAWIRPKLKEIAKKCFLKTGKRVSTDTVKKRLQSVLGIDLYQEIYGRTLSRVLENYLFRRMEGIKKCIKQDLNYKPPTLVSIVEECKKITGKKISTMTVGNRFQKGLGKEIYNRIYGSCVSEDVDAFLTRRATEIKRKYLQNHNVNPPLIYEIENDCKKVCNETVSVDTIRKRFRKILGDNIYQGLYGASLHPVVENFLLQKAKSIKSHYEQNPLWITPTLEYISKECEQRTGKCVCVNTIKKHFKNLFGEKLYQEMYGTLHPAVKEFLTQKATEMKEVLQGDPDSVILSQVELAIECKKCTGYPVNPDTIGSHFKQILGESLYQQWTKSIQSENSRLGVLNHLYFARLAQKGHLEIEALHPELGPTFCEVANINGTKRCDLILPDIYKGGYFQQCLNQTFSNGRTFGEVLGISPKAAKQYLDIIIDNTTRNSPRALKEKAEKYCNGTTFFIMACTGQYPYENNEPIFHPDCPDAIGIPVHEAFKLLQMPE